MTRRPRGIALITALLVVAIATLAATALLSSTNIAIHRAAALRDSEQAWWVARGVESWVLGILEKDRKESEYDGLGEDWAQPVDYLPVDQGYVRGHVIDLQSCFNLNNLVAHKPKTLEAEATKKQFERLLASLPADLQVPPGLVGAIIDWADPDQTAGFPAGAEDSTYQALDPPYRTADQRFTVVSELLAVQGMTPLLYDALRDARNLVCALPATIATTVNVNTADEVVLRALAAVSATPIDENKFSTFLDGRQDQPVQTRAAIPGETGLPVDAFKYLDVGSRYFQIRGEVFVGSSRVGLYSLIHRPEAGTPTVLAHSADLE